MSSFLGLPLPDRAAGACSPVPAGLVSWWRAEGNPSDAVGGNTGALAGNASFGAGHVGQAFVLDGNGDAVRLGNPTNLQLQNLTIEAWIKRASSSVSTLNGPDGELFCYGYGGYGMGIGNDGRLFLTRVGIDSETLGTAIADTNWHHVAVTKSGNMVVFYIDAVAYSVPAYNSVFTFSSDVAVGARGDNLSSSFYGSIDELAVYDRALSGSEIQAIYNAGAAGKCTGNTPPVIFVQPTNQVVIAGDTAVFHVAAGGTPPLSYQWAFNGTNISGATGCTLMLTNVQSGQAGNYAVGVSNSFGSIASSNAVLSVLPPPPCVSAPAGVVSWWRGEGDTLDSAGANNGVLAGNASFGPGRVGQSFVFDGSGDAVRLGNPPSLRLQDFTIEAWIKRASTAFTTFDWFTAELFCYGQGGYGFGIDNSGRLFLTKVGIDNVTLSTAITDTNWHHAAVTKMGSNVVFYIDGASYSVPAYNSVFTFSTDVAIGARGDNLGNSFYGSIDELAVYNRALSAGELQAIYNAGRSGKCAGFPPVIVSHPTNRTVTAGATTTFNVTAGGTPPLSYQWLFNGTNIAAATAAALTLTNVQPAQAGNYAVLVTNDFGSVVSSNAVLTVVFPPAVVRVVSTNAQGGKIATVPVTLQANGNENALGFSLSFDPALLTYAEASVGSGAPGASLILNPAQAGSGRLGVAVALPSGSTLAPGLQQIVTVHFAVAPVTNARITTIAFGDQPTVRQLVDAQANTLPAFYTNGSLAISPAEFEADVSPRTNGNQTLTISDWVQVGRFVARLDIVNEGSEYRRADCAPRSTLGNGMLAVTDWVQAGRYAAGLDPMTPAGGPTSETEPPKSSPEGAPQFARGELSAASTARTVRIVGGTAQAGQTKGVALQLEAEGDENALGFSLNFDPAVLRFVSAALGTGATGASLNLNTNLAASGKLGFALARPTGTSFSTSTHELVNISFAVSLAAAGESVVSFGQQPVPMEVSDAAANALMASYVNGTLAISPFRPSLKITRAADSVVLSWPLAATNFVLQTSTSADLSASTWTNLAATPTPAGDDNTVTLPVSEASAFYRLQRP